MFNDICEALLSFRKIFSRNSPWVLFCMVILGFIGATEMIGVTSFCRFWGVGETLYIAFLHFFRASSWSLPAILAQWGAYVLLENVTVSAGGRAVLLGDHTYVTKDGRRMPGVVSLREQSETQSKPSYFRGHCWGAIGLLVGSMAVPYCLPLALSIQLGMIHIGHIENKKFETLGTRIVQMAIAFAVCHHTPCVMVLDAFFPTGSVFKLANSAWCIETHEPMLTLIVKGKKNCVAFFEPGPYAGSGRPRTYGEKVHLMELFDHPSGLSKAICHVYGKKEEVDICAHNLLWRPTGGMIRFVLVRTSLGPMILMCSDLAMDPVTAVELYCVRTRIEIMFDMLKNMIGAFSYRFWSQEMPRHSRKPKSNKLLKTVPDFSIETVKKCWEAYERFVMLGSIAHGLLILTAIKYKDEIWEQHDGYLRTKSREFPSERTVKYVIARIILKNFLISAPIVVMRAIWNQCFEMKKFKRNPIRSSEAKKETA